MRAQIVAPAAVARLKMRRCKGQVAVILALVLPALIGAVALGTDVAIFYFNWVELQKAADSAVLAGATFLPATPSVAVSTAQNYAELNGIQNSEIVYVQVASNNMSIAMKLQRTVPYYFARVLGLTSGIVAVSAVAGIEASNSASGLVPIGLQSGTVLTPYEQIILKLAPAQGSVGPGNWEPLAMGYTRSSDPGGSSYKLNIEYGYQPVININDEIYTEPGNLVGPTQQGIDYRLSEGSSTDSSGTVTDHTLADPRVITIPIVNFADINGSSQVPVLGFAEFWIVSVSGNGNITGEFIDQVTAGGTPSSTAPMDGSFTAILLQ